MFGIGKSKKEKARRIWQPLTDPSVTLTQGRSVVFKHSTRCGTSRMAISQFERDFEPIEGCNFYLVNVLQEREVSDRVADLSGVKHESPQIVVFQDGQVIHDASHENVSFETIRRLLNQ